MADAVSSNSGHTIFVFLITTIAMMVQMQFPNSSPADNHSAKLWIFMVCLFIYGFSSAYYKSHVSTSNNNEVRYFKLSSHIATISGSMAFVALITVLVSKAVIAVIVILYFMCLLIYFSPNPITEICKKMGSYVSDKCKGIEHNHSPRDNLVV